MHRSTFTKGMSTQAIHAGESPDPVTHASAPNLVMSSTYVVDRPMSFSAQPIDDQTPYMYSRWSNPTCRQLEKKLAALEGAEACLTFASGMAATAAVLLGGLNPGDHLVASDTNYAGAAELIRHTLPRMGIHITLVDSSVVDEVQAAMQPNTKMVWIETPANPILRLSDIRALAQVAHRQGALLCVDSTFATPIATRPIEFGADIVVHSLTKYVGGHGDALGGAVIGRAEQLGKLYIEASVHHGGVLSPFNAWLILRGAATLPMRMRGHQENALQVAQFLEKHPAVTKVLYPGLPSHPQYELAKLQMQNFSGMISFQVAGSGMSIAQKMMQQLEVIHYAVSLGHHRSLIYWLGTDDMMASTFALQGPHLARYRSFAGDGIFRLSVGLEDADDVCRDLANVL